MRKLKHCLVLLALGGMLAPQLARSANRDALREIVQQQCVPHWLQRHDPAPCERVYVPEGTNRPAGYALLPDAKGGAHFLLIPIRTLTGIESPELLQPGAPNYFAAAWQARGRVGTAMGREVRPDQIGLAVNSRYSRGQDQLHIHIECLGTQLYRALQAAGAQLHGSWSPIDIGVWRYRARRLIGASLDGANPFELLADQLPDARGNMGAYTLVVAGMRFKEGPGFVLLAGKSVPAGESLLDPTCAIALPLRRPP